jgi:hypothetical protein
MGEALRRLLLGLLLLALSLVGAGLARASVACIDAGPHHMAADSDSGGGADDSSGCKHTLARVCCAHGGVSSLSAAEPGTVVHEGLGLVFSLRADPPRGALAPAPELAPPRSVSA